MLTLNKTKAALQSCQCYYQKLKQGQNTKGSAGGQRMSAAEAMGTAPMAGLKSGLFLTPNLAEGCAPMERLKHNLMILKQSVILRCVLANSGVADLQLSKGCSPLAHTPFPQIWGELNQRAGCTAMQHTPDRSDHPFGSIPRCCNSLRIIRLIQAASDSSPSCCWACSISSRNSGSSLNWNGGLPRLSFLCVDTSITPDVMCLCVMTHYIHVLQIATPRSAGTLPGRLTKPLIEVTVMAELQHTQTRPKFTWRFLALNRHDKKARPCRLSVEAATERDARRILAQHFILSLAARLPVQEVGHV